MTTYRTSTVVLLLLTCIVGACAGEADRDRILYKDSKKRDAIIESEGVEEILYRSTRDGTVAKTKARDVKEIIYVFMMEGGESAFRRGVEARDRGRYEEAAEQFNAQAQGASEGEKVYGSFHEGLAWELAGKTADAAKAFGRIVEGFPKHRLNADFRYHHGMALAAAKDKAGAEAIVAKFDEEAKGALGPIASARANAIRAALALAAADQNKLREFAAKVTFRANEEEEVWNHFNSWLADAWRGLGKVKDAEAIYGRMLPMLTDPAAKARIALNRALCLVDSDRQAALIELLKLDALPYGSIDQKCEARYQAGRLMLDEVAAARKDPALAKDEKLKVFADENHKTAKMLLEAAAGAVTSIDAKAKAKALLDAQPK